MIPYQRFYIGRMVRDKRTKDQLRVVDYFWDEFEKKWYLLFEEGYGAEEYYEIC